MNEAYRESNKNSTPFKFEMPNPWATLGAKGLGGILSLFKGKSWGEKKREDLYGFLDQFKNKPLINPNSAKQLQPMMEQSMIPFMNKLGNVGSNKVGTGSGAFTGEVMNQGHAGLSGMMLPFMQQIMKMNAQAPLDISRIQAGLV